MVKIPNTKEAFIVIAAVFTLLIGSIILSIILQNLIIHQEATQTPSVLHIEKVPATHYLIANGIYFNISETELTQCFSLYNAVLTLKKENNTKLLIEITEQEVNCIDSLLERVSGENLLEAFCYQGCYYTIAILVP